jgi:hypothetical protein
LASVHGHIAGVTAARAALATAFVAGLVASPAVVRAATMIDGGSVGGQVWTAAGSPYVVRALNGTTFVAHGEELRIEAGTTVLFSVSNGLVTFLVQGRLNISGTAAAPVTLRAESPGSDRAWTGIRTEAAAVLRIAGAVVANAQIGAAIDQEGDVRVDRSTFEDCGIGISVRRGVYAFDSITLRNNTLGIEVIAVSTASTPSLTLTNALVQNNAQGLLAKNGAVLTVVNATLDGNMTAIVGYTRPGPTLDIQNTIISNNRTAIRVDDDGFVPPMVRVAHTTLWANTNNLHYMYSSGGMAPMLVPGSVALAGAGNLVADPKYVSSTDLHLGAGSQCIDSGVGARAPDHDIDGAARPAGAMFDRGAFEFVPGGGGAGGTGGAGGGAGATGAGGGAGTGGSSGGGGAGGGVSGGGGTPGGTGGGGASGGGGTGGVAGTSGAAGGGGATAGGGGGATGAAGSGGASGGGGQAAGGTSGRGGAGGATGSAGTSGDDDDDDGCGCGTGASRPPGAGLIFPGLVFLAAIRRPTRSARADVVE